MQKPVLSKLDEVYLVNMETGDKIPFSGITEISDNEITVNEEMPSRTYVEMYIKSGRYNYLLNDSLYYINLLRDAYRYLCDHPEKIEEVVERRVHVGKFAKNNTTFQWLLLELQVINSWIMDETFSGDTVYTVPVSSESRSNERNPIYIPKHIQHRKKGRK